MTPLNIPVNSIPVLQAHMAALTVNSLASISAPEFQAQLHNFLQLSDHTAEGFATPDNQRRQSLQFSWGHDHDFGDFSLPGEMGTRHLWLLSRCLDAFQSLPSDLSGARVLDVGCWTGGVSLLAAKMGAEVVAIDEVKKYVDCLNFLAESFGLANLTARHMSLYDLADPAYYDTFDHVLFFGVLYHLSDPIVALRHLFNVLKPNGRLHLETMALDHDQPLCRYEGPGVTRGQSGWNWFVPSPAALQQMLLDVGFRELQIGNGLTASVTLEGDPLGPGRAFGVGVKQSQVEITRAGLSNRHIR
ncbi:MAG: DUF1698 domain-containing protein [Anaerolineae bacterium]|nr:DUF1698 domain-containing protein [Anaerolineae bacterium]